MRAQKKLLSLFFLIVFSSCLDQLEGTRSSNPGKIESKMTVSGELDALLGSTSRALSSLGPRYTTQSSNSLSDLASNTVVLQQAWFSYSEMSFTRDGDDQVVEAQGLNFENPSVVDALNPQSQTPASFSLEEALSFSRVSLLMGGADEAHLPSAAPPLLGGHSFVIEATVSGKSFSILGENYLQLTFQGDRSLSFTGNHRTMLLFGFQEFFEKIDFSSVSDGDEISDSNPIGGSSLCPGLNPFPESLYTCVLEAIERSGQFGFDRNQNFKFDLGEEFFRF